MSFAEQMTALKSQLQAEIEGHDKAIAEAIKEKDALYAQLVEAFGELGASLPIKGRAQHAISNAKLITDFVKARGTASVKDIKAHLASHDRRTDNAGTYLSQLKKAGKLCQPEPGMYTAFDLPETPAADPTEGESEQVSGNRLTPSENSATVEVVS